ncbi:BMP family ABC transporter substrate-binding protein, partial [Mesorhizobium sp. M5C.F.Ca.IN.020.32.2.1]
DLKADTFGTKSYSIGLKDDSVKLLKTAAIPDDVWAEIQALREDIISGKTKVDPVYDAAAVRALMTSVAQ